MTLKLTPKRVEEFNQFLWEFFAIHGRTFAWRQTTDPYAIVVSEIMLQQTQTERVSKKFDLWLDQFPSFKALAEAPWHEVLAAWQGLGYNRRALALHKIARLVIECYNGNLPQDPGVLETFPGIGKATAASICAFAFNAPTIFVETNIRSVFIATFFEKQDSVHDKEILQLVAQTCDAANPREWYYALMDYGVFLKKTQKNPSRKSKHHTSQSRFEGSERQIRGLILKEFSRTPIMAPQDLYELINRDPKRIEKNLAHLIAEGMIFTMDDGTLRV